MNLLPAIDLKDGQCVRLYKGDYDTAHRVADDPYATASRFIAAGTRWIHVVDLDGAKEGRRGNAAAIEAILDAAKGRCQVELGGGLRTIEDLAWAEGAGIARFILGSAAVENEGLVRRAVARYGEGLAVGIDAQDGYVRTRGWTHNSGVQDVDFARKMQDIGVKVIIFTDIDTDGTLQGPALEGMKRMRGVLTGCQLIASGGVGSMKDIEALKKIGVDGAIVGKAIYSGAVDLDEAMKTYQQVK